MAATTRLSVNITNETAKALRSLAEKEWRKTVADIVRQTTDLLKSESLSMVSMAAIPAGSRPAARLGSQTRAGASWEPCSSAGFTRSASTMPGHQWTVPTLIREVLADPNLARRASSAACPWAGLQDLVDAEAAAVIGAGRYERTSERTNRRNGTRPKTVATTAEEVELAIPKLRTGSFFPSHTRRRVDKALYAVICQAWIEEVSTRKVNDLVKALGNESGISRSTVSRICKDIDEDVHEFLSRRLDHTRFPYLFVDATYLDVRAGRRVVSRALVVATGVSAQGRREIPEHGPGGRRDHRFLDVLPAVPARTGTQGPLAPRPRGRGPGHQ